MAIPVYDPGITVTLFKMIKRVNGVAQRYAGLRRQLDLTPLLGEGGAVRTSKNIQGQPAGAFSISFPDQPDTITGDTLYALIEPMDMIEIRMARSPGQYASSKLPLVMRGFISTVTRSEAMGTDGTPQRFVIVSGQDMAKLWLINAVFWPALAITDPELIAIWAIGASIGMAPALYMASSFVQGMVGVLNKRVADLAALAQQTVLPFTCIASVPEGYIVPAQESQITAGSYWDIVTSFADQPWNEIFVRDAEAGPQVIYRPVPFKDINGNFIMPGAVDPGSFKVDISDVISMDVSGSDERIANIFWTDPTNYVPGSAGGVTAAAVANGSELDFQHQNNLPTLFGRKILTASSNLQSGTLNALASAPEDQNQANGDLIAWWQNRNNELKLLNRDNSVFEDGSATMKGSELLVPGQYMKLTRGALTNTSYAVQVDHNFMPFQG